MSCSLFLFALILPHIEVTSAYERVYLTSLFDRTGSCSYQSSLEYGFTVEWDPNNNFNRGEYAFRPGWIFDCVIIFKGRTDLGGMPTRTSLTFRDNFIFAQPGLTTTGPDVVTCDKAYIQLFKLKDYLNGDPPIWTHCSIGDLPGLVRNGNMEYVYELPEGQKDLTLRFYVDFHIQKFKNISTKEITTTTVITTPNPKDHCRIHFHADFTSYVHKDTCVNQNDDLYLRCNDSKRCVARTDVCDFAFGRNCRDNDFLQDQSDLTSGYPAYCARLPEDQRVSTTPGNTASITSGTIITVAVLIAVTAIVVR